MREYHGSIALRNAQRDEEQKERDTDDDVAVEYRDVVDKLDGEDTVEGSVKAQIKAVKTELEGQSREGSFSWRGGAPRARAPGVSHVTCNT